MWKPDSSGDRITVIAQLNARVQPIDRGNYFEDPLDEALRAAGLGEVAGGGTQLTSEPDGIAHCDIEIAACDSTPSTIEFITETLEDLGAPKGSLLKTAPGTNGIPFGKLEGMAVFLNGTDLPEEVYAQSDVNLLIASCDELLKGVGCFRGYWEGSRETSLYFYGSTFEAMKRATADFIAKEPLCQLARVEQIA
ncbi:hypothetical protein [Leisingera sp. ANG-Vp]|uniref:hypothetical protein n=1 Tax=Leisingera sp. ANG-Vp TaxID=1577896 RepID=UPI00126A2DFD|nr:hypothetical protein [Leisingera sp. ANG-Vp]